MNTHSEGYSDPLDPNLLRADPPLLPDLRTGLPILPGVEEIILRLFYGWMVLRVQSLCHLSGYSERIIRKILPILVARGWIRSVGRPTRGHVDGSHQELYILGSTPPKDGPYDFKPRLRYKVWDNKSLHSPSGLVTSRNFILPAHPYYVSEAASWIAGGFLGAKAPCLAVPEQVLRQSHGWYSPKKEQKKQYFRTSIPDAWLILKQGSFLLEVQISETSVEKIRMVCDSSPLNEPVLYVVTEDRLFARFSPLLDEYPFFFLVRLGNKEDMAVVGSRFNRLLQNGGIQRWPMRDYYANPCFALAVMNPETGLLFGSQHPHSSTF